MQKVEKLFNWGARYQIGNGFNVSFWGDIWVDNCSLKVKYDKLFNICQFPDMSVADGLVEDMWKITFARVFGEEEKIQWKLWGKKTIMDIELSGDMDNVVWCLEKTGLFSMKSLYKQMVFGGVICRKLQKLWKSKIPLKAKIFVWQCYQDRVQTANQLKKRGWKGDVVLKKV